MTQEKEQALFEKKTNDDNDPDWKNGVYIGKTNIGAVADLEAYKKYAEELSKKGKDFLLFSEWRTKIQSKS